MRKVLFSLVSLLLAVSLSACFEEGKKTNNNNNNDYTFMTGDTAHCEFDIVTFRMADGSTVEVSINGLEVEELDGVNKLSNTEHEVVKRRGVRFAHIFAKAGITAADDTPVNCIARDGYDVLRARLDEDVSRLPTFEFVRDFGYVYVGNPGDKDPLFPAMEGRSLMVDYDIALDAEVPIHMGDSLLAIAQFRFKMVEKVDDQAKGIFEVDPVVTNAR